MVECVAESTQGLKTAFEGRIGNGRSTFQPREGLTNPSGSQIGQEGHAVVGLKPSPGTSRFDPCIPKVLARPAPQGIRIDLPHDRTKPVRHFTVGFHRAASQAGAKPGGQGVSSPGKELHVFPSGFPSGTGRPTENPGGSNTDNEEAFEGRISGHQGVKHGRGVGHEVGLSHYSGHLNRRIRKGATDFATWK